MRNRRTIKHLVTHQREMSIMTIGEVEQRCQVKSGQAIYHFRGAGKKDRHDAETKVLHAESEIDFSISEL